MYIVKNKNYRVVLLDDYGFSTYTKPDENNQPYTYTLYMPKDEFVENIEGLKGKPVNFEHEKGVEPRGVVADVIQNLEGIKLPNGDVLEKKTEKGEWYAILDVKEEHLAEAKNFQAISTEYVYDKIHKEDFETNPISKALIQDGKIDGDDDFDVIASNVEYKGIAFTNTPKRTRIKGKVYNAEKYIEKNLDNAGNDNKLNKLLKAPMEKEDVIKIAREVATEVFSKLITDKEQNAEKEEQERMKNEKEEQILNSLNAIHESIKNMSDKKEENSEDKKDEEKENNEDDKSTKDEEKNSEKVLKSIAKASKEKSVEENSSINDIPDIASIILK